MASLMEVLAALSGNREMSEEAKQAQAEHDAALKRLSEAGYDEDAMCKLTIALEINSNVVHIHRLINLLAHLGSEHGAVDAMHCAVLLNDQQCIAEKVMLRAQEIAKTDLGCPWKPDLEHSAQFTADLDKQYRDAIRKQRDKHGVH